MNRRKYYLQWGKRTFDKSIGVFALLATILAVAGGALNYFIPDWIGWLSILVWALPLSVLGTAIAVRLFLAPFTIQRDQQQISSEIADRLQEHLTSIDIESQERVNTLEQQVQKLVDQSPVITVVSDPENNYVRLLIENQGGSGEFRALGQVVQDGVAIGTAWHLKWRGTFSESVRIDNDGRRILELASTERLPSSFVSGDQNPYFLRFHTALQRVLDTIDSDREINRHYFDDPIGTPEIMIEIRITANPRLRNVYCQRWVLKHHRNDATLEPFDPLDEIL